MPKAKTRGHRVTVYLDDNAYKALVSNSVMAIADGSSASAYGVMSYTINEAVNFWDERKEAKKDDEL